MRLERHPGPIDDPFMAAVRRRHADVDLVLLPAEPVGAGAGEPEVGEQEVGGGPEPSESADAASARERAAALVARVAAAADRLWSRAADDPAVVLRRSDDALVAGPAVGAVVGRSRRVADSADGDASLSRLAVALREEGWRVARTDGPVRRLSATRPDLTLRATHVAGTGGLMLEIVSPALDVGPGPARELLDGPR